MCSHRAQPIITHIVCAQLSAPATDLWGEDKGIGIRFHTLCSSAIGFGAQGMTELEGLLGDSTLQRHGSFMPLLTSLFFCNFLYLYRYMINIKPMHVFFLVP